MTERHSSSTETIENLRTRVRRMRSACEALEWELDFYRDQFLHGPDMSILVDVDTGAMLECNRTILRRLGYAEEDLVARPYTALFAEDPLALMPGSIEGFRAKERVPDAETEAIAKDGRRVPVAVTVAAIPDQEGRVACSCLVLHDLEIERGVFAALADSERRFARLANTVDVIPWEGRFDGRGLDGLGSISGDPPGLAALWRERMKMTYLGPQCERIFGFPYDVCLQQDLWGTRVDEINRSSVEACIRTALATGETAEVEFAFLAADGRMVWLLNQFHVVREGDGAKFVGVLIDITDRKVAADLRAAMLRELDHRVKNTLVIMRSLADRTAESVTSPAEVGNRLAARLDAMARVHALASSEDWQHVSLDALAQTVLGSDPRIQIAGRATALPMGKAQPLGMALHELAENARLHGSLACGAGRVSLVWIGGYGDRGPVLRLYWQESGGPPVQAPYARGVGLYLIEDVLPYETDARARVVFLPSGVGCRIEMPL